MTQEAKPTTMSIENNSMAFRVISKNIYKNGIRAIIRELSTNCVDAHIVKGNTDVSFEVKLPVSHRPSLSIRDFGHGMSEQEIDDIYKIYFKSTKTDKENGAYGLGGKSPFAYRDDYYITSYQNGIMKKYKLFWNYELDVPIPDCQKVEEVPTTEPDGLEVTVPNISPSDFYKFEEEAISVFKHFADVRPVLYGSSGLIAPEKYTLSEPLFSGENYKIYADTKEYYNTVTCYAIVGSIGYSIQIPELGDSLSSEERNLLSKCRFDFYFDKSAIKTGPGREEIVYDKATIANIVARIKEMHVDVYFRLQRELNAIDGLYDTRMFYAKYKKLDAFFPSEGMFYRGEIINTSDIVLTTQLNRFSYSNTYKRGHDTLKRTADNTYRVQLNSVNIVCKAGEMNKLSIRNRVLESFDKLRGEQNTIYTIEKGTPEHEYLVNAGVPLIDIDSLPELEKKARSERPLGHFKYSDLYGVQYRTLKKMPTGEIDTDECYYIRVAGHEFADDNGKIISKDLLNELASGHYKDDQNVSHPFDAQLKIFFLSATDIKKISKSKKMVSAVSLMIEHRRKLLEKSEFNVQALLDSKSVQLAFNDNILSKASSKIIIGLANSSTLLGQIVALTTEHAASYKKQMDTLSKFTEFLKYEDSPVFDDVAACVKSPYHKAMSEFVQTQYPMLKYAFNNSYSWYSRYDETSLEDIVAYATLVESTNTEFTRPSDFVDKYMSEQ